MRLRKRRRPELVIPTPVVGGHRFMDWTPPFVEDGLNPNHFLWGIPENAPRRGLRLYPVPDEKWAELYAARKQDRTGDRISNVTYDPKAATEHLLRVGGLTQLETENHESE